MARTAKTHCTPKLTSFRGNAKGRIKIGQTKIMHVNKLTTERENQRLEAKKRKKGTENFEKYTHTSSIVQSFVFCPRPWRRRWRWRSVLGLSGAGGLHSIYQPEEPLSNERKICFANKIYSIFFFLLNLPKNNKQNITYDFLVFIRRGQYQIDRCVFVSTNKQQQRRV